MSPDAVRGRMLLEESREAVVVLDAAGVVVAASRRARQSLGIREGAPLPADLLRSERTVVVAYEVDGAQERLAFLSEEGDLAAYEELRSGFTAAVSHELRTPLARLLSLLELAALPGEDVHGLVEQARGEVGQIRELIDEVLFLAELESGTRVVSLGAEPVLPVLHEVVAELADTAERAGVTVSAEGDAGATAEVRPRMMRVVARNLAENAIRYAGTGATATLSVARESGAVVLRVVDDGVGVADADLPRLFERFYRADRSRGSRGTGLGLAIVKHVVTSAGGTVEARRPVGSGLEIRCTFPAARA